MRRTWQVLVASICIVTLVAAAGCPSIPVEPIDSSNGDDVDDGAAPEVLRDPVTVAARVVLPTGIVTTPVELVVSTIMGDVTVDVAGSASPSIITTSPSFAQVVNADGKTILLGFVSSDDDSNELSARSTAAALLFFSLGGFAAPAERVSELLEIIEVSPSTDTLASVIETAIQTNISAVTDGDVTLESAMAAAHEALVSESLAASKSSAPLKCKGTATASYYSNATESQSSDLKLVSLQQSSGDALILLSPDADVVQSGVQVLHNDQGGGIIAQNNTRRRATLFAYLVATKSEGQDSAVDLNSAELIGQPLEIPGSARLSTIGAALSFTGTAPWAPVSSEAMQLPRRGDVEETIYKLVVLGPSLGGVSGSAFTDSQLTLFHEAWEAKIEDLQYEVALWDFGVPVIEFLAVGGATSVPVVNRVAALGAFRALIDPELAAAGLVVSLTSPENMRLWLKGFLEAMVSPNAEISAFGRAMLQETIESNPALVRNSITLAGMETGLARAVSTRTILVAVELAFGSLDLLAVLNDLSRSSRDETWRATVVDRRVRLEPSSATVSFESSGVLLTATVNGLPDATFLYRWSTTGTHGRLFTALGPSGTSFDSTEATVQYIADATSIEPGEIDTVTVEVFEDNASDVIPAGAVSLGSATAVISGEDPNDCTLPDLATRPSADFLTLETPESVRIGDSLSFQITINPEAIEAHNGVPGPVWVSSLFVSGAIEVVEPENQHLILLDGAPMFPTPSGNVSSSGGGTISTDPLVMTQQGFNLSGGGFIQFHTDGVTTHTISIPISLLAQSTCSDIFRPGNLSVSVDIFPRADNLPAVEQYSVFDYFVVTDE